jgi:phosphoribosylglycinamide formyltransferase-1
MEPQSTLAERKGSTKAPLRLGVLISGSGSGMEALIRAQQSLALPHQTAVVVSNRADAQGLARAQVLNVPTEVVLHIDDDGKKRSREEHEEAVMACLEAHDVEFVVLSGYMRLMSSHFLARWSQRVVNIHPSLLPHFPGAHAHRDVLASGTAVSGCTVHLVDEGMDTGPVLAQACVPVFPNDSEATLSERVKVEEHRLYPDVLTWIAEGRVFITDQEVIVDGHPPRLVR